MCDDKKVDKPIVKRDQSPPEIQHSDIPVPLNESRQYSNVGEINNDDIIEFLKPNSEPKPEE